MHPRAAAALTAALLVLALTACTPEAEQSAPTPSGRATSTVAPSPEPASSSTPTVAAAPLVVVGVDGITVGADAAAYTDPGAVRALMTTATGVTPTEAIIEDPWGNGTEMGRQYDFGSAWVTDLGGRASVAVVGAAGDVRFETSAGLAVGTTRAAAEAAGAWEEYAGDSMNGPVLAVDARDVPGTTSLSRPGQTGREYVALILDGDTVAQIQAPGNDFSDL